MGFMELYLLSNWDSCECLSMKIKGKWIFIVVFLTLLIPKWRIFLWLFCVLSTVLRLCFFRKVFLKSNIAVALRRSLSNVPCIFINIYNEYFCKLMWLSEKSLHVLELLNIKHQCKMRFLDINMQFIEQNIHVLCNMKSYECHLMKIIKG